MKRLICLVLLVVLSLSLTACGSRTSIYPAEKLQEHGRIRTIITTDGEVDDQNSLIRYLLYANEFDTRGIVLTSSLSHYAGAPENEIEYYRRAFRWGGTEWVRETIDAYAEVEENLRLHDPAYPSSEQLLSVFRIGNIACPSDMAEETAGSELIREEILKLEPGILYIQCWGGANTVARALKSIEEAGADAELRQEIAAHTVLYLIGEQDDCWRDYISVSWPELTVIINSYQFWTLAYTWKNHDEQSVRTLKGDWLREHILLDNPLLQRYNSYLDGHVYLGASDGWQFGLEENMDSPQNIWFARYGLRFELNDFISEGDSPAFLFLLNPGLRSLEDFSNGSWGGRFAVSESGVVYTDMADWTLDRWVEDIQNDFACRILWCTEPYEKANHAPALELAEGYNIVAAPGAMLKFHGSAADPDGDALLWSWQYDIECSTSESSGVPTIRFKNGTANVTIPHDCKSGDELHIICTVSDQGDISMKAYARIIIRVL